VGDAAVALSKGLSSRAGGEFSAPDAGTSLEVVDPLLGLCSPAGGEFCAGLCIAGEGASATFLARPVDWDLS
jgi:hypothetical protein